MSELKYRAQGRWHGILAAAGFPADCLRNKHQPCPICGGKDRFRFDDKQGKGTFFCNGCGAGDGFKLLMLWLDCDFKTAARRVSEILGMGAPAAATVSRPVPTPPPSEPKPEPDQLPRLVALWEAAQPVQDKDPVCAYLRGRGLSVNAPVSSELRYQAALPYWVRVQDGSFRQLGTFPAMLAAIRSTDGQLQGLHQTYLQGRVKGKHTHWQKADLRHPETGESLPAKKMRSRYSGSVSGAAVQLDGMSDDGRLLVCEGIETALAARELFALPVWAALSANGVRQCVLPESVERLFVCADHDEPRPIGYEAARHLATRATERGIRVQLWQPETAGDALDELHRRQRPAYRILENLNAAKQP